MKGEFALLIVKSEMQSEWSLYIAEVFLLRVMYKNGEIVFIAINFINYVHCILMMTF